MWKSVREWIHAFPNGFSLWELESLWTFEFLKNNLRGQNLLDWRVFYTIERLLRNRCLKWVRMIHLSTNNTSYGQKKGRESKCQFDSQPLKIKKLFKFHACKWHATYHWKALNNSYNFVLNLTSIEGSHKKLWAPKMARIPISKFLRLPTQESQEKWHLGVTFIIKYKEYYKGEGGGFFQVPAMMSLVSLCMPVICLCTKSFLTMHLPTYCLIYVGPYE